MATSYIFQPNLIAHVVEPNAGRNKPSNSYVTHYIGRFQHPLVTSQEGTVFMSKYGDSGEAFSGPVRKLTFLQLGDQETLDFLTPFANTCFNVDFSGHISNVTALFSVIHKLHKVSKVAITIGPSQQYFYEESEEEYCSKTPSNPAVKKLKLTMDLDFFHSFQHDCGSGSSSDLSQCSSGACLSEMQFSLVSLVESILKHAGDSFPNLKNLIVELPENMRLCNAVQSLIQSCPALRSKTQTSVENIAPRERAEQELIPTPFYNYVSPGMTVWPNQMILSEGAMLNGRDLMKQRFIQPPNNLLIMEPCRIPSPPKIDNWFSPQSISTPLGYRPPPGFPPLSNSSQHDWTTPTEPHTNSSDSAANQKEACQRVKSWLSGLEK